MLRATVALARRPTGRVVAASAAWAGVTSGSDHGHTYPTAITRKSRTRTREASAHSPIVGGVPDLAERGVVRHVELGDQEDFATTADGHLQQLLTRRGAGVREQDYSGDQKQPDHRPMRLICPHVDRRHRCALGTDKNQRPRPRGPRSSSRPPRSANRRRSPPLPRQGPERGIDRDRDR